MFVAKKKKKKKKKKKFGAEEGIGFLFLL